MGSVFGTADLVFFVATLVAVMALGLYAGRREESSEDYFLAGRSTRWWGVAGSIFGSNVSANHTVGMLGIGYSVGFAQSHFELGAIAGLMLLCYGFLPVYRKLNVYTLSEYLSLRYDERSRVAYAIIMVLVMVVVQMVPGFYIGSRSMNRLLDGTGLAIGYEWGIVSLAAIAAVYTILGGLKAVIITDVIQSVLLLAAGILIAILTFAQPEIGGWTNMMELDAASGAERKMRLYLPSNHSDLPWTGALTGLMALHFFYWGTNQFIVQRALSARSDNEARLGIVAAGFLKLLIPFFAIGTGIAAYYLFNTRDMSPDPDVAFSELVPLVVPLGYGLVGVIAAGLIGAILSSIDSMMNSAATIVTIDVYKRYLDPDASERRLILVGRLSIVVFVTLAALMAIYLLDPESKDNFFLKIADQQAHLIPGLLVVFALGMFWRGATAEGAFTTILGGPFFSVMFQTVYNRHLVQFDWVSETFGPQLNFLHRVALAVLFSIGLHVVVSRRTQRDREKERFTWTDLGGHEPEALRRLVLRIVGSLIFFALLAWLMISGAVSWLQPASAGVIAAAWTLGMFVRGASESIARRRASGEDASSWRAWITEDRIWAGVLCSLAVFMMFRYY